MAALHPHQHVYFNALVDTKAPGALAKRYDMDYLQIAQRQSLERLLARYPDDILRVWPKNNLAQILPQKDRDRLIGLDNPHAVDFYLLDEVSIRRFRQKSQEAGFYIHPRVDRQSVLEPSPIHAVRAYGSAIALIYGKDVTAYHDAYADVAANGEPLARVDFDIYAYQGALYYLSSDCPPPAPNQAALRMFLHITPANPADLPAASREHGFENRDFLLDNRAAFFDGKCIHRQLLPNYPIARIATGQKTASGVAEWRADINLAARAAAQAVHDRIAAGDYGPPVAQSHFDLYLRDNALTYLKAPCALDDAHARFFLHIIPADPADLPAPARERGFANLDFHFADHGARIGDKCVATLKLPDYPIDRIRTGQFVSGEGAIWRVDFAAGR